MSSPSDRERERREKAQRLHSDLEYLARNCLKIRTKAGGVDPLQVNRSQHYLHERLEDQLRRVGRVRALVLKSRQVGISTYIGARYYHKTIFRKGTRTQILTHLEDATRNLFGMVQRFHDLMPDPLRPATGTASAKELTFPEIDSGYKVGTAGNRVGLGRGDTIQLFHGSEVGYWPSAEEHFAGIMQAVAGAPGTEIILESTANGIGGAFHAQWKAAQTGNSEFDCIFIPWFWHEEYEDAPPADWTAPQAFADYAEAYQLTPRQVYWAWRKNRELSAVAGGSPDEFNWKFRQEYPANADEAFQTSGQNHFIRPEVVLAARKRRLTGYGPIVLGIDPARGGNDKTGIIDRQGRVAGAHVYIRENFGPIPGVGTSVLAGRVVQIVKDMRAKNLPLKKIAVDCSDGGAVYDPLVQALGTELVVPVMFGDGAYQKAKYANRRAEMWDQLRQWFEDAAGVSVPDKDDFQGDMTCTAWGFGMTHLRPNGQLVLEPKEKIRERLKFSPDIGDALALTLALDLSELREIEDDSYGSGRPAGAGSWMM